jgi:hypothetical protein
LSYKNGRLEEKRQMLDSITSNLSVDRKNVTVALRSPFQEAANLTSALCGGPVRDRPRTFMKEIFGLLLAQCKRKITDEDPSLRPNSSLSADSEGGSGNLMDK